ncbi:hypothetical protein N9L92_05810, partial [Saprospiraceae bacterium]|nr:hypothetical protein [Saprospiraceae bacterium]
MKIKQSKLIISWALSCAMVLLLSIPSFSQVSNDDRVNFRIETVSFEYDDCEFAPLGIPTGIVNSSPVSFKVNDDCFVKAAIPPTLPITFNDSEKIASRTNSRISERYELRMESWLNNLDIPFRNCDFSVVDLFISTPFGDIPTRTASDFCFREEVAYRDKQIGDSGEWNTFSETIGPNTINFRQVWRFANGDDAGSALNFGTFTSGVTRAHQNSNNSITVPSSSNPLGYTNKFSGLDNLNNSADVVYRFTVASGSENYRTEISTDFSETNFDTEIHLLNSARTQVIVRNDDISSGNLNSKIITTLSPGTYYIVVEGALANTAEGDFQLSVSTTAVLPTPGSITQPSPAVFCSGALLPAIPSNVAGGTNIAANASVTYKWFNKVGNGSFNIIPGATGATLTAAQAGPMPGEDISFKRRTVIGSTESGFTNTVTFTTTDILGVIRLASNSPICSGDDGEFYLESEDGAGDAGVVINYDIDGNIGSATLDASGKATVTSAGLTSASTMILVSSVDGGCTAPLTLTETIGLFATPITIGCGQVVTGTNASGTNVALTYSGTSAASGPFSDYDWQGNEVFYEFQVLSSTENVRIALTDLTADLDIF